MEGRAKWGGRADKEGREEFWLVGWLVAQKNWTVITEFSWEYLFMIYFPVEEYIILLVEIKIRGGRGLDANTS